MLSGNALLMGRKSHENKTENTNTSTDSSVRQSMSDTFQFEDNSYSSTTQKTIQKIASGSPQVQKTTQLFEMANKSTDSVLQTKTNNTGLPDNLKSGVESLSGYSMDDVKVHYNSSAPAQLNAHAYAQGTDIHVAPGQEKHVPHEAWHVVQQKQGRVQPTKQLKGKVAINDDAGLEKEADVMGARALNATLSRTKPASGLGIIPSGSPAQLTPEEALGYARLGGANEDTIAQILEVLRNTRSVSTTAFTSTSTVRTFSRENFIELIPFLFTGSGSTLNFDLFSNYWNNKLKSGSPELLTKLNLATIRRNLKGMSGSSKDETDSSSSISGIDKPQLIEWFKRKVSEKSMVPEKKFKKMLDAGDVLKSNLPEDFWVALKLFFTHTANFDPIDKQGRDISSKGDGGYYRSSDSVAKDKHREVAHDTYVEKFGKTGTSRKTFRPLNKSHLMVLQHYGAISKNLTEMELLAIQGDEDMTFGMYKSAQGSHVGSLGLLSSAMKSMRQVERMKTGGRTKYDSVLIGEELKQIGGVIDPKLLAASSSMNYHDFMLNDRAKLVQEVSVWIKSVKAFAAIGIQTIQSGSHPSLILYHKDHTDGSNEKDWRELVMNSFNSVSKGLGYNTQANRRGSFGFLYPTMSSVGGPVRVWPGMVPAFVFKQIMQKTLVKVFDSKSGTDNSKKVFGDIKGESSNLLHVETLKTAVRHTQTIMSSAKSRPSAQKIYVWLLQRLFKNLQKANFLLETQGDVSRNAHLLEQHYLKTTLVVENLMEYTYLLESLLRERKEGESDPYTKYAASMLLPSEDSISVKKGIATYYTDSGMQAIVGANLLAKGFLQVQKSKKDLKVLDVNSYFEYGMVNKGNLELELHDPKVDKAAPDIISADINPVLTSPDARKYDHSLVLDHYAESKTGSATIPIIDVTNSTLTEAAKLNLGGKYTNFIVVESLTKHHQLGADKYTMGRVNAVGTVEFLELARQVLGPIEKSAHDPLLADFRLNMDKVFYGGGDKKTSEKESSGKDKMSLSFLLNDKTHKEARLDQDKGLMFEFQADAVQVFRRMERGIFDHKGRGDSCGFLTLNKTREEVRDSLMTTIFADFVQAIQNHGIVSQRLNLMMKFIGDEIYNSSIVGEQIILTQEHLAQINYARSSYDFWQNARATNINSAKDYLATNVSLVYKNLAMNDDDAILYLTLYGQNSVERNLLLTQLNLSKSSLALAEIILRRTFYNPGIALDYVTHNLIGTHRLGINTARAWAVANNIELHIWTHLNEADPILSSVIQEISPQDVSPGASIINMLHTWNQSHFQELVFVRRDNLPNV